MKRLREEECAAGAIGYMLRGREDGVAIEVELTARTEDGHQHVLYSSARPRSVAAPSRRWAWRIRPMTATLVMSLSRSSAAFAIQSTVLGCVGQSGLPSGHHRDFTDWSILGLHSQTPSEPEQRRRWSRPNDVACDHGRVPGLQDTRGTTQQLLLVFRAQGEYRFRWTARGIARISS